MRRAGIFKKVWPAHVAFNHIFAYCTPPTLICETYLYYKDRRGSKEWTNVLYRQIWYSVMIILVFILESYVIRDSLFISNHENCIKYLKLSKFKKISFQKTENPNFWKPRRWPTTLYIFNSKVIEHGEKQFKGV